MRTREIPTTEWAAFLAALSDQAGDQGVNVRLESPDLGDQELAHGAHLLGIACQEKGSAAEAISVSLTGARGEGQLTHLIAEPERVYVQEDESGHVAVLDIEDSARVKTLIFFDAAPEA